MASKKRMSSQAPSGERESKEAYAATDKDREHQLVNQMSPQLSPTEEKSDEEDQEFTYLVQIDRKKPKRLLGSKPSLSPDELLAAVRLMNDLPEGPLVVLDNADVEPMRCVPDLPYKIIKKAVLLDTFTVLPGRIVNIAGTKSISLYTDNPGDNDCRRAFSLVRWLVVHSTVFVAHRISEVTDLLQGVDHEVFSEEADLPTATNLNESSVKFNALFAQGDLAPLSLTNENPNTIMLSVALCLRKLSLFEYCDTAKCESQFHQLWAHIMDALLVANATSLSLVWEFDIKAAVPGYKAKHYTDLTLLLGTNHGPFPILLMELAGSRLLLTDDHKDFQKLVADMALILLFQLDVFKGLSVDILQDFRIFGVLANRFSFDLLCLQPVVEDDEHGRRSVSFLLQYDRTRRKALVPGIESLADTDHSDPQVQFAALSGSDVDAMRVKVIEEDINRERAEDDDLVPGLADQIKSKPRTDDDNIESLRPLVAFCNRVRKYAQTTKAVLDDATPAEPSGYVERFPKAPSSRTSGHGQTPGDQRRRGPQSGPSTRSGSIPVYGGGQPPSASDAAGSRLVDAIGGYDVDVLSRDQHKTVVACSLDNGRRRVISCSRRPSSSTDLDMCRRLTDDRYVPKVFGAGKLGHDVSYLIFEELSVGPPSPRDIEQLFYVMIKLFRDILMALDYFRQERIVHRDISDSNIMYSRDDSRWKIIDLELAIHLPESDEVFVDDCVVGTSGFIAPEVTSSMTYSFSSDIWSFGMVSLRKMTDEIGIRDGEFSNDRHLRSVFDALVRFSMSLIDRNPSLRPSPADAIRSLTCIEQELNQVHLQPCPMA